MKVFNHLRNLLSLWPAVFIITATAIIVFLGRGYRPSFSGQNIKPTGLLVARSDPDGAQVFVNGNLKTATNNTINVDPDWYMVKIAKEGFIPWEKTLRVQGEVVTNTNAFLFPTNPSLSPLTATGITNPVISPDGTKIAYIVPPPDGSQNGLEIERAGLWIFTMTDQPLAFNRDPQQVTLTENLPTGDNLQLIWSPDSSQILILSDIQARLFDADKNGDFTIVTSQLSQLTSRWQTQLADKLEKQQALLPDEFLATASDSAVIITFSPDETKVLYEATASATLPNIIDPPLIGSNSTEEQRTLIPDQFYVYDIKEDKNYFVISRSELVASEVGTPVPIVTPTSFENTAIQDFYNTFAAHQDLPISWFPTSRHLILQLPEKIDIMEYDRTNWITVYSGPHDAGFVVPWPGSSRLLIMTNLNTKASKLPNLYSVNLR